MKYVINLFLAICIALASILSICCVIISMPLILFFGRLSEPSTHPDSFSAL
ncbi:hypothetical protein [Runella sp.]|uniref:hypothetical protein n=1 Tax=Runella sp. TaxID=1960881 RepID=UPI003D0A4BFA